MRRFAAFFLALSLALGPAAAQDRAVNSPVLTVDQERLYDGSLWGKRVLAELEAASEALQSENRRIEAELTAEEKSLTERRAVLPAEEFRGLADAFDQRVQAVRRAQEAKLRDLTNRRDEERRKFFDAALPVMIGVMEENGAVAILDHRAVLLSVRAIDATDKMLSAIDSALGNGGPGLP
jgi:Skp family chaperone for outer membrane proteins